jgi:hypothetical protein
MVVGQELSDMANRSTVAEHLIRILSYHVVILMTDEARFHFAGCINKQNFHYWAGKIHNSSINSLFTVHMSLFGVEWQTSESKALIFLKMKMGMQLQLQLHIMLKCYETSLYRN